jgi:hypothetical protein
MRVAIIMNGNGLWAMQRGLPASSVGMHSRLHLRIVIDYPEHDSVVRSTLPPSAGFNAHSFQRAPTALG